MDFYTLPHKHYCGVDLQSRTMYLCIVGRDGAVLLHRDLPCNRDHFLLAIAPYREDLVVAVECIQITHHQYNVDPPGKRITYRSNREDLGEGFEDSSVRHSIAADLALADHYEVIIGELELAVLRQARIHDPNALALDGERRSAVTLSVATDAASQEDGQRRCP
jgi:hypothetical protein